MSLDQILRKEKPWINDSNYFTHVKISAPALIKMLMHATSGGNIEVMGLMQGTITEHTLHVTDAFRLPVEGTETRVNAQQDAAEYMCQYLSSCSEFRKDNVLGWYHSHPGYGCWLSGIDVATQQTNQQFQEPFLAVVLDPLKSLSNGKVDIGAFRTYPQGKTSNNPHISVPQHKEEDYGVHAGKYYSLEIEYDPILIDENLMKQNWKSVLSKSIDCDFNQNLDDLCNKLDYCESEILKSFRPYEVPKVDWEKPLEEQRDILHTATVEAKHIALENGLNLMSLVLKKMLFQ